jgi:hypothetical protein
MPVCFLDTNILLRFLTKDDEQKAQQALNLLMRIERGEEKAITSPLVFLRRSTRYKVFTKYLGKTSKSRFWRLYPCEAFTFQTKISTTGPLTTMLPKIYPSPMPTMLFTCNPKRY